jgi:hypothetical protein
MSLDATSRQVVILVDDRSGTSSCSCSNGQRVLVEASHAWLRQQCGHQVDELVRRTEELVVEPLGRFAASPQAATDPVVSAYAALGVRYDLDVVLPEGDPRSYRWEFGSPTTQLTHRIAASALVEWATHAKDFFSVRCWSRRSQLAHRVRRDDQDALLDRVGVPDLLMHYLITVAPGSELAAKHHLDSQLRALTDAHTRR